MNTWTTDEMLARNLAFALLLPLALPLANPSCVWDGSARAESPSDAEFGRLIREISEEGGYFWSNNYISNETSYLHALPDLDALSVRGGVYVGVGPNQNFTYIAAIRPELAFIVDIRRQNLLEHLLFKVLIENAETPEEYLSSLLGRPLPGPLPRGTTIANVVSAVREAPPDEIFFRDRLALVESELRSSPDLALSEADFQEIRQIYREFFNQGFEIKYDSWRSFFFPSFEEFILETDLEGRQRNWLASREDYAFVRTMQRENRIIPVVGDFAGNLAFRRLGRFLESRGAVVSAFYVSNVEFYLFRQRKWSSFVENVRHLPTNDRSVFIRAYANLHRPHPKMIDDHITVTLVQNIHSFLRNERAGRYNSLWDVVTIEND